MSNTKQFAPLGPPPKQPRKGTFVPRSPKLKNVSVEKVSECHLGADTVSPIQITNLDLLSQHDLNFDESERANRPFKAGEVIMTARPFAHVLATSCRGHRCEGCFQQKQLPISCECNYASYCSNACLDRDKVHHEDECYYIKQRGLNPTSDTFRIVLRIVLLMRSGGHTLADRVPGKDAVRKFSDLLDHYDDILVSPRLDNVDIYYEEMVKFMGDEAPGPSYFLECYGRMVINSFHLLDDLGEAVGTALYLGPSIVDHSCVPNASVTFDGVNIVFRTLVDLDELDFSKVFISYIDLLDHRKHRREHLLAHYYFPCGCSRCNDYEEEERSMFSVLCRNCQSEVYIDYKEEKGHRLVEGEPCPKCDEGVTEDYLERYSDICELTTEKLNGTFNMCLDAALFCLKLMDKAGFAPFHIFRVKATEIAVESYLDLIENEDIDVAAKEAGISGSKDEENDLLRVALAHGRNLVAGYARYSRHVWSHEGFYLLKIAELESRLGFKEDCRHHFVKGSQILNVALGDKKMHLFFERFDRINWDYSQLPLEANNA